ncbi:MAG: DoxX family protein [Candidatus Acidiferrales bacterium]
MLKRLLQTNNEATLLVARLALAIVMFPHGAQKLLGWFGGGGFVATVSGFQRGGIPAVLAVLVIAAESLGSLSLALGFLSRFCAFGIGMVMVGAVLMVHYQYGFFMNWLGNQKGEGFEYHLLALGLVLVVLIGGGGRGSLDRLLTEKV